MSNEYSPSRPQGGRRGRRRSRRRNSTQNSKPAPAKSKPSLWSKIAAFFGIRPKSASAGSPEARTSPREDKRSRREASKPTDEPKPGRPVVRHEVTSPRLYVGNLSFDATESDLFELFSGAGSVVTVEVVCNRQTHKSKGFGFVQMQTIEEARRAVEELHDKEYMGRKLLVSGAKPMDNRADRSLQPEQ